MPNRCPIFQKSDYRSSDYESPLGSINTFLLTKICDHIGPSSWSLYADPTTKLLDFEVLPPVTQALWNRNDKKHARANPKIALLDQYNSLFSVTLHNRCSTTLLSNHNTGSQLQLIKTWQRQRPTPTMRRLQNFPLLFIGIASDPRVNEAKVVSPVQYGLRSSQSRPLSAHRLPTSVRVLCTLSCTGRA